MVGCSLNSHVEFQQNHTRNSNNISPSPGCKYKWFQAHHSVLLLLFPHSHPPPTPSFARGWGVTVGSEVAPVSGFHHTVLSLCRKEGCWHCVKKTRVSLVVLSFPLLIQVWLVFRRMAHGPCWWHLPHGTKVSQPSRGALPWVPPAPGSRALTLTGSCC